MINEFDVQFKNNRLEQLIKETYEDEHLSKVLKYLDEGWPKKIVNFKIKIN